MEMKSLIINGKKYDKFTPGDATDPIYPFKVREMIVAPADEEGVSVYSEFVSGSDQNTPILNFNGTTGDEATILRNVADPAKNSDAANKQYVDNKVSGSAVNLSGATAGQIPQISAVDASGKPTAWKAVDMPSGGSAELPVSSAADSGKLLQVGADGKAKWGDKLPTALKNPAVLTFTGAATGTYDGSEALTINIPEGGSGGSTGGGLREMSSVSGYLGIPVAQLPQDGTIWMCISSGDNAELYSGTITIEGGGLAENNLIAVSSGSVIQLNQAAIVSAGFAIYGMPATDYTGVWQLMAQKGDSGTDLSLGVTGATIGQIAKITAVDTNGKPTAWEPVDMPSGGGSTWVKVYDGSSIITEEISSFEVELSKSDPMKEFQLWLKLSANTATDWGEIKNIDVTVNGEYIGYHIFTQRLDRYAEIYVERSLEAMTTSKHCKNLASLAYNNIAPGWEVGQGIKQRNNGKLSITFPAPYAGEITATVFGRY